jgi:hypothetical protein
LLSSPRCLISAHSLCTDMRRAKTTQMTAEEFCEAHGDTFLEWLQDNTVECACEHKYGCDETKRRSDTIDAETEITPLKLGHPRRRRCCGESCLSACCCSLGLNAGRCDS